MSIDLRSDTVTVPTAGMRKAMAEAEVGDDVYGEDPSVNALEAKVAGLFGKEAGLFTTTGSLSNLLGIYCVAEPGQEVLCDNRAHIVRAELGAHAALHGITTRTWVSNDGLVDADTVEDLMVPDGGSHLVSTAAVEIENTHNFGGGTVHDIDDLRAISELCRRHGVKLHLDGARIWNAHIATGVPLADYGELFDTVSVCFSKGLGAPVGSMLLSTRENIAKARIERKRLGGGWRQAGVLAAAADYAVENQLERLAEDHQAARVFAEAVADRAPGAIDLDAVVTNIVVVLTGAKPASEVIEAAAAKGVRLSAVGRHLVRAVTHLGIGVDDAQSAGEIVGDLLGGE
ncbi:MAG: aminotransferase class I/II-fold pyridoxal phosphate-dependent enzyme [Propionibacteriaceae bacterium]|jgi:threonine aldolase|nr:aminotransferase class I/II-fold pyridoxal phosphate-dependent enzyme [Propionibacteriaceae bacterium]